MKVLILGATGHIGRRLTHLLAHNGWASVVAAARRAPSAPAQDDASAIEWLALDTLNGTALQQAVARVDAVVNCVAGDERSIGEGAKLLALAMRGLQRPLSIVHMSSMAVYGAQEGKITESSPLDPTLGWYAKAKCDAEAHLGTLATQGHNVVIFRPGCVYGPGSTLWVDRTARLLMARRIGDLGPDGDGWSNLVHVDDVCRATLTALRLPPAHTPRIYNLADPASPRWNQYFADLAVLIGAVPVQRVSAKRVKWDAALGGPVFKVLEKLGGKLGLQASQLPVPISPSLFKLWPQQIQLNSEAACADLGLAYTPYRAALEDCIQWFKGSSAKSGT